jgi:hypothetical protein
MAVRKIFCIILERFFLDRRPLGPVLLKKPRVTGDTSLQM